MIGIAAPEELLMGSAPLTFFFFFLNDPAPPESYPLPLPAALPIPPRALWPAPRARRADGSHGCELPPPRASRSPAQARAFPRRAGAGGSYVRDGQLNRHGEIGRAHV